VVLKKFHSKKARSRLASSIALRDHDPTPTPSPPSGELRLLDEVRARGPPGDDKPLRRNMDIAWRDEVVDIFRVDATGDGPALEVWQAALRLRPEDKFTLILALLAEEFGGVNPYCVFHPYRRLLLRLLEADNPAEGDLIMAVLHRLHEVPPYKRRSFFDRMARNRIADELEDYLAVDWTETAFPDPEAEETEGLLIGELAEVILQLSY